MPGIGPSLLGIGPTILRIGSTMGRPLPYMDHSILIRPHRKRLRWRSHDDSADGTYFVTICALGRACVFGEIADGVVRRTAVGDVVDACWRAIPDHFPEVTLDAWLTMPNHLHGIIAIGEGITLAVGPDRENPRHRPLGTIIRLFKSAVMKRINQIQTTPGASLWQRGYHDRVMRDAGDLVRYRQYIADNPARWPTDEKPVR